jgi:hypothetical protein
LKVLEEFWFLRSEVGLSCPKQKQIYVFAAFVVFQFPERLWPKKAGLIFFVNHSEEDMPMK